MKISKTFFFSLLIIITLVGFPMLARAGEVSEILDQIKEWEGRVSELLRQEKTLQNELAYLDSQISLTTLRIQNSIAKIAEKEILIGELSGDIEDLVVRIDKITESINFQQDVLNGRIRERYKSKDTSILTIFFGTSSFSDLVKKSEYLMVLQEHDQRLLEQMTETKNAYGVQRRLFEIKKAEEEELRAQLKQEKANLDGYMASLDNQKESKNNLLRITQNDEAKFQGLIAEARRELAQIVNAASALQDFEPKGVDRGEIIGVQGNTGYSTGDHLHFGVYKYSDIDDIVGWDWYYSNTVNPKDKLKSKTVYWDTGCESSYNRTVGSGDWRWPMDSPTISQGYGQTCHSWMYDGKDHPAYDMYGVYGAPIYAVEDGKAYFCRDCLGDGGNGVFLFHDDDKYMTLYWHLQ